MFLLGTFCAAAAPPDPAAGIPGETPVRIAVEIAWTFPGETPPLPGEGPPLTLEMTDGKVVEALAWLDKSGKAGDPGKQVDGTWALGAGSQGRVRARIEAPLGAAFLFRAGGQELRFPLVAVLEGPQHTPPQAPVEIALERLAWDSLTIQTKAKGPESEVTDGTVAPGATVPVAMGLNIVTPEPAEVTVHCSAELRPLRGGDAVWRAERQEIVPTNRLDIPARPWLVPAPRVEGTYVLEFVANWEPVMPARKGSVLSRLIRGRRPAAPASNAMRRVTLAVMKRDGGAKDNPPRAKAEQEVDAVDLSRPRGSRLVASGRAPGARDGGWDVPEAALVEPTRRDRRWGWILRGGPDAANLGAPDQAGQAWSALGLKVAHPGRPHRLTVKVTGGHPAALGVALLAPAGPGKRPRVALDVCASGPPVAADGPPRAFSWLVWPDAAEPVLVMANRGPSAAVQLGSVSLTELPDAPAGPSVTEPEALPRGFALYIDGPAALERFGAGAGADQPSGDAFAAAQRLARYLTYCGATSLVVPERLAERARRQALHGQAAEDALGPDRLDLLLRVLACRGLTAWLELDLAGPLPGLPAPDSAEALARGLVRVNGRGEADGAAYHPLHPDVRAALRRRVANALATRQGEDRAGGLLIRLGPGPTLLGGTATGLDDSTYERFAREMFDGMTANNMPGLGTDAPDRFAKRAQFLMGPGRTPWLTWRARGIASLYGELAAAARETAPEATLAVATPSLDDSPAGDEARRADSAGMAPSVAWRNVGLDLDVWPTGRDAPLVLRGVDRSGAGLARDLALSPELDAKVTACPARGLLLAPAPAPATTEGAGPTLSAPAVTGDEAVDAPLGHALAALDARALVLSLSAVAGHEERLRRFAQVYRALPAAPPGTAPSGRQPSGVAVRALPAGENTFLALANDTPYPLRVEAVLPAVGASAVDDLGRGLRLSPKSERGESHLVLDMPPFGASAVRVASAGLRVESVATYPSDAVKAEMLARYNALTTLLTRLNQGAEGSGGPPNAGFEPRGDARVVPSSHRSGATPVAGWQLAEATGMPGANAVAIDPAQAHAGQASLRLTAGAPPASVVSDRFTPNAGSSLTVTAWLRAGQPDTRLRLWIEGESAGRPFLRRSELTIQPEWGAQAVRASDLPAGGLDWARLRFELPAAGSVWVDDLSVAGESLSDTERAHARRALVAAMHAHRENRYADFARFAGSHWATRPATLWGDPAAVARGGANALPSDRRLR